MVSSGNVQSDLSSFQTALSQYTSCVDSLSTIWTGDSHDNLSSKSASFVSEYESAISSEMSAFASACDLYQQYIAAKQNYNSYSQAYNQAVANKDTSSANSYYSQAQSFKNQMSQYKSQIESYLATASAISLEATPVVDSIVQSSSAPSSSSDAQSLVDIAMAEIGNGRGNGEVMKYLQYAGFSDPSTAWCAIFASWVANQAGYGDTIPVFTTAGVESINMLASNGCKVHYGPSDNPTYDYDYVPQAGDLVFYDFEGDNYRDHVGIVIADDGDYIITVEGNTSAEGDAVAMAQGQNCVSKKRRSKSVVYAYVTPEHAATTTSI